MHVCTYTHPYIHIYFTARGPPKHQRVMYGRRNFPLLNRIFYTFHCKNVSFRVHRAEWHWSNCRVRLLLSSFVGQKLFPEVDNFLEESLNIR